MPDDIFFDKARQEWKRLQKALKKNPQNPTLLKDLYRLYVSVEKIYWENNEKASSSTQTKKEAKKLRKLEKFFLGIVKKSGLDTDTVHRNLAKEQIKTLQGLLEKYPHNAFLHSTLQAIIDGLDPWISDSLGTSQETSSEDQLTRKARRTTLWQHLPKFLTPKAQLQKQEQAVAALEMHHNNKWKALKKEAEDWLTELKSKHDSELHFMKIGWQLQKELVSQATDPTIKYLLLKDLKKAKSHIEIIPIERRKTLQSLAKRQLSGRSNPYISDINVICAQGKKNLIAKAPPDSNLYISGIISSIKTPFLYRADHADGYSYDIENYESLLRRDINDLENFPSHPFRSVEKLCQRLVDFGGYPPALPSLLTKEHKLINLKTVDGNLCWAHDDLDSLAMELHSKLKSFVSNTRANINYLHKQYKRVIVWQTFLQDTEKEWSTNFAQDFFSLKKTVKALLSQKNAQNKIIYENKRDGIKKLVSEAFDLHQLKEKYEILHLLRKQDSYNPAWHKETEKTIAEIEVITQGMSSETIKKKIIETEAAIKGMSEKQKTRGQIITRRSSYIKSPLLQAQLKEGDKIATAKATLRQLKLRYDLLQYDVFKVQLKKWQAFLKTTEENYRQTLSQVSSDIATWQQIRQDLRQVDENFEQDVLLGHIFILNGFSTTNSVRYVTKRVSHLTLGERFNPEKEGRNASLNRLQERFNFLVDYLGISFDDQIATLSYKDLTTIEKFLPEMQAGRNTKLDCVLYSLKQEYNRKLTAIGLEKFSFTKERKLRTLYQKYAQKAQALVKVSPSQHRQDRQIFSNIMQASYQFVKQNKKMYPLSSEFLRYREFVTIQELLNHTNNSYLDNYWLYAYLDVNWMSYPKSEEKSDQLKSWIKNYPPYIDLNLVAVEKYWNDCVFKIKQWRRYSGNIIEVNNIKSMIDYFLPVAKELVETSSSQHLKERKRFLDALNTFSSDCTARINQPGMSRLSEKGIDEFSTTHDPSASIKDTYNDFDNNDSISLLIRDKKVMPFPDMREDPILEPFSSPPQHLDPEHWRYWDVIHLTYPAQGWKKVEQLVQQGVTGVELEKALTEVVKDAGLKPDAMTKLQAQISELQKQHKSSHDILKALQKTINTAKTNQNPWRFSNTQIGGLVSRVLPSSEPSTTFSSSTPSFYSWEPAFDLSLKLVDEQFPFTTTSGAFFIVTPGMATQADKKRSAYVFNQPQQGFSFGQGQSAFYLPAHLEQGEFNSPHRHRNPSTPIEMPSQELPDMEELRNGAVFAWIYTPKIVETHVMNQARVVQLPVQVSQRIAIGAESFRNITQRSFLPNIPKGYEGRIIPLHPNNPSPSTTQSSASSSFTHSSLAKGVGYYMIGRVTVSAGHEIYQGVKGQQSWGVTAHNLADLAIWVVVGICFSVALPKVALVAGTGVIAHDFVTYVLPSRHSNSYLTPSERLMLQTKILQRDYGDKAVMSFPMFGASSHMHIHTGDLNDTQQKVADAYHLPGTFSVRHIQPTRTHYDLQLLTIPSNNHQQVKTFVVGYWDNKFYPLKQPISTSYPNLRAHGTVKRSDLTGLKLDDKTQHVLGITK